MSYPPYQGGYPAPGFPQQGGMPQPAPAGLPYPAQPYPNQAQYPPAGAYPPQMGGAYPPQGGMPMPGQAPYPSDSPYPSNATPYPTPGAPYAAPYPAGGGAGAPYPPAAGAAANAPYGYSGGPGAAPYPSGPAPGAAPYPSGPAPGAAPYPSGPALGGAAPYPSGHTPVAAPYPSGPAPGAVPYQPPGPTTGTTPYQPPSDASLYPNPSQQSPSPHAQPHSQPSVKAPSASSHSSKSAPVASSHISNLNSTSYCENAKKPGDSGTIKPLLSGFNPETDATQIKNCLKGMSINEMVLVNILPHRSNSQRQKIRLMYKTMYGKDLLQDLRDRLTGDFESVTAALLMTPSEYDAYIINKAVRGAGTDEDALIETLCTRTNSQIREVGSHYKEIYKATIEQHMQGDSSGHFKRMLISLANGARQEDQGVNPQKAEDDAKKLYKAGAGRLGTDESTFNSIFVSQSFDQLRAVFAAYQRLYKKDIEKVIKSEMSGDLETGMKTIARFTLDKHSYFANVLYKSMKGIGTDERTLIRTLVTRSEIDLEQIIRSFSSIKGESKPLSYWIKKETSGPFRDMLVHLIGEAR